MLQLVISNGYYGALALRNMPHFAPDNWDAFEVAHQAALKMVDDLVLNPGPRAELAPIPADAVAQTAFGMHFMTDAFSSGHMRVPRAILGHRGGLLAKVMHDIDGKVGLFVENGFNDRWRAFGDGYLNNRSQFQRDLLARLPDTTQDTSIDANTRRITSAIGSAMQQVHYQAQKYLDHPGAQTFQAVLSAARGGSSRLAFDDYTLEGLPGDPNAGRDAWITMDIPAKLAFLRKHQPHPEQAAGEWLTNTGFNVPELILSDGSINADGEYSWDDHFLQLYNDRVIRLYGIGDVMTITDLFQVARNMPSGADWYGPSEQGLMTLLQTLSERQMGEQ
jgi:hypothetical protein